MFFCMIFFFKQKTAYELRISDWSSDVCSSDLHGHDRGRGRAAAVRRGHAAGRFVRGRRSSQHSHQIDEGEDADPDDVEEMPEQRQAREAATHVGRKSAPRYRSEEHTSELQSLMRISYAVFCLKKKTTNQ